MYQQGVRKPFKNKVDLYGFRYAHFKWIQSHFSTQQTNEHQRNQEIPIIACTAHDDYETETKCKALGMLAIINKPVFIKQLQTVIQNIPKTF
ncbi:unnamed protein product [Paramecium octaurelia]|uniref:Response regulatory domain-containing protein n=1 Tax=Paramecium octaurelia TaxID=43137 RepID=A0A8S1VQ48_PAROT|nr:unnamed protein product [Paramecium octaurelia]